MAANSQSKIKLSKTPEGISPEPKQPWWTEESRRAVARARKARNLCDPSKGGISCDSNKAAWKEKENEKKRIVVKAKKMSMNKFINSLSSKTKSTKTWAFAKAWANGTRPPDLNSSPIKDPTTYQPIVIAKDKANILASQYDHHKESIPDDPKLEIKIAEKKSDRKHAPVSIRPTRMKDGHHHPDTEIGKASRKTGLIQTHIAHILPGENNGKDYQPKTDMVFETKKTQAPDPMRF